MTHPGKTSLRRMVVEGPELHFPHPVSDHCVQQVAAYVAALLKLIIDIDASDFLEHSIRCTIHAHGDLANAVCSCGLNALQERINEALA